MDGLDRVLLVRGGGREVITIYSQHSRRPPIGLEGPERKWIAQWGPGMQGIGCRKAWSQDNIRAGLFHRERLQLSQCPKEQAKETARLLKNLDGGGDGGCERQSCGCLLRSMSSVCHLGLEQTHYTLCLCVLSPLLSPNHISHIHSRPKKSVCYQIHL